MIVVADTGPINYLIAIAQIELLPRLYVRILIPDSVRDELQKDAAPKVVRQWIAKPPEWLEIRTPTTVPDAELLRVRIGPGERGAILLFGEIDADQMIIDDLRGRKEAERRGIHAIGTLGVLRIAAKRRLLNLKDARCTEQPACDKLLYRSGTVRPAHRGGGAMMGQSQPLSTRVSDERGPDS